MDNEETKFIIDSILENCTFVDSWDDLSDDAVKIVPKKEAREYLIQNHINNIKNDNVIKKHIVQSYDEYREGDKWKELNNNHLKIILNRKLYEPEELVLHKNMITCMTHNKIISNNIQVLYSQGSLAIVKDFNVDVDGHLESVDVTLLPPGVKCYTEILETWNETTFRLRTTIPVQGSRGCKIRRTQYPFCYSN